MEVSAFDLWTLGIATLGLVLSLIALVWQIVSWQFTGPRVKVTATRGWLLPPGETVPLVIITVRNVGREPVAVQSWGLVGEKEPTGSVVTRFHNRGTGWHGEQFTYPNPQPWQGPSVPYTLAGNHQVTWSVIKKEVSQSLAERAQEGKRHKAYVDLATGKRCHSREVLTFEPVEDV